MPAARVVALARYADQAWATQLADLALQRRIATLVACTTCWRPVPATM